MKLSILALAFATMAVASISAKAQDVSPATTAVGPSERFQIFQSPLAAKWTFKIDRYCGRVSQLVVDKNEVYHWEVMDVSPKPSCGKEAKSHFEIFSSGLSAKFTFMYDASTGMTWQLVHYANDINIWQALY